MRACLCVCVCTCADVHDHMHSISGYVRASRATLSARALWRESCVCARTCTCAIITMMQPCAHVMSDHSSTSTMAGFLFLCHALCSHVSHTCNHASTLADLDGLLYRVRLLCGAQRGGTGYRAGITGMWVGGQQVGHHGCVGGCAGSVSASQASRVCGWVGRRWAMVGMHARIHDGVRGGLHHGARACVCVWCV